jgi:Ankyrin repeats (3 copies)
MAQQLEASLTKHKRPHLAKLLDVAKLCKCGPLKRYLEAGGTADAVVMLQQPGNKIFTVPLLHSAVLNHHLSAEHAGSVEVLLSAGARVDSIGYAPNGSDRSCLMWVAEWTCCTEPLKLLLHKGADPCYVSKADGLTALHTAAVHGQPKSCKLLLAAGGTRALNQRVEGMTPLCLAVGTGQVEVVKVLLKHGTDLKTVVAQGESLLVTAVSKAVPVVPGTKRDIVAVIKY